MGAFLRSVWAEPRPPDAPARVWRDWALLAVLVPLTLLEGALRPKLPLHWLAVAVTAGLAATLLWRRTRPLLMVAISLVVLGSLQLLAGGVASQMYSGAYVLLLMYAMYRWGSGREVVIGTALVLASTGLQALAGAGRVSDIVAGLAVLFGTMTAGGAFRFRARAQARTLDQVRLLERERLARELHDTVAHHVSAIAIRAQAGLATSAAVPGAAEEALRVVEAEASRALAEMRAMVRVLRRNEPAQLTPGPGIAELASLAEPDRDGDGPAVDIELSGDVASVSPIVGAAVYRLAQESVTNARRHARHATRVRVSVAADETSVRLLVSDDGESVPPRLAGAPGYGLMGMAERARLLGGSCEAGPDPAQGWTVSAILPRNGAAA